MNAPSRAPAGTPTGGQFAPSAHSETDVALSTFTPDELVSDTKWKVVEHQSVGATTTATVTRGPHEKLNVTIDYDSGTVSMFDAHGEVDAPPIQETQWDDSEPFDGVGVARDTLAATPPPSQPLTPALAKRNARVLDNLAVMFQDPEWGSGMLEDVAEQVGSTGRPLDTYDDDGDWEMAEGDGCTPTGTPGTPEHDHAVLDSVASWLRKPEWSDGPDMLESFAGEVASTGRDVEGDGKTGTWGRH